MWTLLNDNAFRQAQITELKGYTQVLDGLQRGIRLYAKTATQTPSSVVGEGQGKGAATPVVRLCWLALQYGDYGQTARNDVQIVWQWAREGMMEDALQRIDFLSEKDYFKSILRLLWIEADRMRNARNQIPPAAWSDADKSPILRHAQQCLDAFKKRIPTGSLNWQVFWDDWAMAYWISQTEILELDYQPFMDCCCNPNIFIETCLKGIHDNTLPTETYFTLCFVRVMVSKTINDDDRKSRALGAIAAGYSQINGLPKSAEGLEKVIQAVEGIAANEEKEIILQSVSKAYLQMQRFKAWIAWFESDRKNLALTVQDSILMTVIEQLYSKRVKI